jgi:glycine/D-amino acid oxidase-like deaminating enzyme
MKVIVIGGGIIGCATAYYLTQKGASVTIVERHAIACGASGKAGGFLAQDWNDIKSDGKHLSRKSFDLHAELAQTLQTDCGYRKLDTLSVVVEKETKTKHTQLPQWVNGPIRSQSSIGSTQTTAQVHPGLLSHALVEAAQKDGLKVVIGIVENVEWDGTKATGVKIHGQDEMMTADVIVFTLGPWTYQVHNMLPKQIQKIFPLDRAVYGIQATSIIFEPTNKEAITPHALFADYKGKDPEVYPRPDGTVYICGLAERVEMPQDPSTVSPKQSSVEWLTEFANTISTELTTVKTSQACILPCTTGDGKPLIGRVPGSKNAYIATGHSCWGILNAPATGLCMSELIMNGTSTTVDISPFDPQRIVNQ